MKKVFSISKSELLISNKMTKSKCIKLDAINHWLY